MSFRECRSAGKKFTGNVEKCDEDIFERPDGTVDWVRWEIRPWYEEAGQVGGIILFSEVVTQQKLAAEELEMSRQQLLGLINSAMDSIVSLDENGKVILFNPAAEKIFGVSAEEMLGKPLDRLIPERYRRKHEGLISAFGESDGISHARHMMGMRIIPGLRANGEEFPMEASISKIEVGGKKIYTVIHRDVTEQVKAREELRESEEKFRTLYENSSVGIYRTTPDGRILLANPALVAMLGYSSYEDLSARNLEGNSWQKRWTANPDFLNFGGKTLLYYRGDGTTSADDGAFHDQIGVAELNGISTKGISYELLNHGHPIVPIGRKGSFDDGMVLDPSAVQFGSRVFLYYSAIGTPGYHIGLAVSSDGVHFRKMGPVIEGGIFHRRYVCPGSPIVDDGSSIRAHGREPGFRLPPGVPRKLTGPEIFSLSSRVSWGYQGPLCYIDS